MAEPFNAKETGRLAGVRVGWRNKRGSAGAERPPSWVTVRRPFGARVGVLPCRGCKHIVSEPPIPPYGVRRRAVAFGIG
jgi:hypothetical protein